MFDKSCRYDIEFASGSRVFWRAPSDPGDRWTDLVSIADAYNGLMLVRNTIVFCVVDSLY